MVIRKTVDNGLQPSCMFLVFIPLPEFLCPHFLQVDMIGTTDAAEEKGKGMGAKECRDSFAAIAGAVLNVFLITIFYRSSARMADGKRCWVKDERTTSWLSARR
ncbi:MAG: hypothetical protein JNL67_12975 [Planctomycetaceae bacterium]|nr:hypothetical protein [Planctomycetaceae bacterium]